MLGIVQQETSPPVAKPTIAICSQDAEFYLVFNHILEVDGFSSMLVSSVDEMFQLAAKLCIQGSLLDCRSDNQSAVSCNRLRQGARSSIPVVALIAPGAEGQHLALLKSGIDECFVRPLAPSKLLAYLHTKLATGRQPRRLAGSLSLHCGDIEMQIDTHRVRYKGEEIRIGPIEFKLLRHMLENPERVLSRDELIKVGWPSNVYVDPRTVDVHVSRLRKSFSPLCDDVIRTVRLGGYVLQPQSGHITSG